ncbi:MAG: hypothetical protein AB8G99_12465, partial [Planctomycetaceae bacterium]
NDTAPQVISTPADITAQFQSKGDIDRFEFTASKGQAYVIEVIGQRRIPTLDPWFILEQVQIDKPGKETTKRLTTQDDTATNIGGNDFWTANADPQFRFTAPATGRYRLSVRDRYNESRGDPSLVYRVVIRPGRPDFRLIVLTAKPAAAAGQPVDQGGFAIRSGGNAEVDVMIIRRDGFAKPVRIRAENLPPGVRCDDVWLDKNQSRTKLVLTASTGSPIGSQPIRIVGETVGSSPVARIARTATVVRRTPGASQSRLANDAVLSVLPHTPPLQLQSEINEITANQSQQILVPLKLAKRNGFDANVNVTFTGQPANVEAENKPIAKGQNEGLFRIFLKNNTPPGTYTIIPRGTAAVPFVRNVGLLERAATAHAPFVAKAQAATKAVADAKTMAGSKQTALTNLKKQSETFSQQLTAARLTIAESQKAMKTSESQLEQTKALLTNQTRIRTIRNSVAKSLQTAATAIANDNTLAADVRAARELVSSADKAIIETKDKITTAQKLIAALGEKVRTASNTVKSLEPRVKEASMKIQLAEAQVQTAMAALKASEEQLAQANKEKTEADKTLKAIQDKNKPQNINVYEPSTPIVIHVKKSPLAIAATVPNGGNIKRGQSLEVAIKLNRKGFQGPVRVLFHCPASDDVHASPIVIAGNTISGSLQLKTKPDATKSILTNCVIRAEFEQGHAFKVDAPIKIQVQE